MWKTICNWMCHPQIHMLKSYPQCDGVRRWALWQVMGSWAFSKRLQKGAHGILSCPFFYVRMTQKAGSLQPGRGPLPEAEHAGTLNQDFSLSKPVRNKCILLISHPVWDNLLWQPELTKAPVLNIWSRRKRLKLAIICQRCKLVVCFATTFFFCLFLGKF